MNSNGKNYIQCVLCASNVYLKEETLHSWNTEMQRHTTFGMSLDRHLKPKGNFFSFKYLQKKEVKDLPFHRLTAKLMRIHSRGQQ